MKTIRQMEPDDKFVRVQMSLTPDLVKALDAEADKRALSRSVLVRMACERLLRETEQGGTSHA